MCLFICIVLYIYLYVCFINPYIYNNYNYNYKYNYNYYIYNISSYTQHLLYINTLQLRWDSTEDGSGIRSC